MNNSFPHLSFPHLPESVVGEIIEASTARFVAQCPPQHLHIPPALGTFVKVLPAGTRVPVLPAEADSPHHNLTPAQIEDPFADPVPLPTALKVAIEGVPEGTLYAVVGGALTGSGDLGRRAVAYGLEDKQLLTEQPQIYYLLATEFVALPFGIVRNACIRTGLPPVPPRLHAFVDTCSHQEVRAISETPDFVRHLFQSTGDIAADDLLAACLAQVYLIRDKDFRFLVRAGKQLAVLLRDAPDRLAALLRKLEP